MRGALYRSSSDPSKVPYVSLVPIGRLVGFDHRSGLFVFNSNFLRANEAHRSAGKAR